MRNKYRKQVLQVELEHMEYYNKMSPFPQYDTYYVELLKTKIKMDHMNYDEEPVVACSHCKRLFIITDEDGNDHCAACRNSINDTEVFANIFKYLEKYGKIWGIKRGEDEQEGSSDKDN